MRAVQTISKNADDSWKRIAARLRPCSVINHMDRLAGPLRFHPRLSTTSPVTPAASFEKPAKGQVKVPLVGLLLVAALGCSAGRLRYRSYADGERVSDATYSFRSATFTRSGGGWVVELQKGSYKGVRFLVLPNLGDIAVLRITLPRDPREGVQYPIGRDHGSATVEVEYLLGHTRRLEPGTIRLSQWDPEKPYVQGTLQIRSEGPAGPVPPGEPAATSAPSSVSHWEAEFRAPH